LDRNDLKLAHCAHAIALYAEGLADRKIAHITHVPGGMIHRLALDVAWVLDGLHKLSTTPRTRLPANGQQSDRHGGAPCPLGRAN
jgi:helicase